MFYKQPEADQILIRHGRAVRAALPDKFVLCSWNCLKGKRHGWAEQFMELAARSDLFFTQEMRFSPAALDALALTPMEWNGAVSFFSFKGQYPTGVATGCVCPAKQTAFQIGEREPLLRIPKMTLAASFPLANGKTLWAVNMHAVNFTGPKTFEAHMARAAELLLNVEGPILLGGDFNVWNRRRLDILRGLTRAAGLCEVPFSPDGRSRCLGCPVDFLFVRGLTPVWTAATPTDASDHNPLIACLQA